MTAQVLFEIRDTDPDSSLSKLLREVTAEFPEYSTERDRLIGGFMILRGTQMLELAAIREADRRREKGVRERAAATRAAKKGLS